MAELTEAEFISKMSGAPEASRITPEQIEAAAASAPTSASAAEFARRRNAQDLSRLAPGAETLRQSLGEEGQTPLDIESGLGISEQFQVSRRRTPEDKIRYLANQFGAENVRLNKKGEPIVRITDEKGNKKDILVNARGLSVSDLGSVVAHLPELFGALVGPAAAEGLLARVTGSKPVLGTLAKMFSSAVGAEAGGAAQDVVTRAQDQAPLEPAEIFMERGKNVIEDTALQAGAGAVGKGLLVASEAALKGRLPSPVKLLRGPIQNETIAAAERIQGRTGLPMSLSAGQSTGNPFVAAAEQYLETNPIGAGPQLYGRARREAERVALQDYLVHPDTLPLDEEIGRKSIGILAGKAEASDKTVSMLQKRVQAEGQKSVEDLLAQRFNKDVAPKPEIIAQTLRKSGIEAKEAWDAEVERRYQALWSHPKANVPDVPTSGINEASNEVLKIWPKDPVTGELVIKNAPEGLLSKVQEAARLGKGTADVVTGMDEFGPITQTKTVEGKMPLRELAGLRTFLDQNITGGQAIAGIKEGKLVALRKAVNETIKDAVSKDPDLEKLYRAANDYYAESAPMFNNKLIDQLFKRPEHSGYIGDTEFLDSITKSGSQFKRLENFFGRSSDEMRLVRRDIADDLLRRSVKAPGSDVLDPETLLKNMEALRNGRNTRSIFYSVFGKRGDDIITELDVMKKSLGFENGISAKEFTESLDPEALARPSIKGLIASQQYNEEIYANNVIKRFVKGELPATAIRGEDFVNKWLDSADLEDVKKTFDMIKSQDPELAEQISRRTLQKFFTEASRQPTPSDVLHTLQEGTGTLPSGVSMSKQLGTKDSHAKLEAILGKDKFDLLKDYIRVELSEDEKKRLAAGTGILTRGSLVSAIFKKGFNPGELKNWMKVKAISYLLASDKMSSWLSSGYKASDLPDLFKTLVSSEPFIGAVADDLRNDSKAFELISAVKHAGFGYLRPENRTLPNRAQVPTMTEQEFINAIGGK